MSKIYQASLLQALVSGYYDGVISVSELKRNADVAIGTFEGADGELIMVDNIVYKAKVDGKIEVACDDELIPFCNGANFKNDYTLKVKCKNILELKEKLNIFYRKYNNMFMVIKINGLFKTITVRSLPKQNKPYKPLDYIVEHEQKVYSYNDIYGTVIGFKAPSFMNNINTTDYHLHFIDMDKYVGGHVLDISFEEIEVLISIKKEFSLVLPNTTDFNTKDFLIDKELVKKVEE